MHRRAADAAALPALRGARLPGPGARASTRPWSRCARSRPKRRRAGARRRERPSACAATATRAGANRRSRPTRSAPTEVYLAVQRRHRRARGPGPGNRSARGTRRAPRARARRSFHAQREPDRGVPEGDAGRAGAGHAVQEAPARARDARAHPRVAVGRAALRPRRLARAVRPERSPVRGGDLRVHRFPVGARRLVAARHTTARDEAARLRDGWIWTPPVAAAAPAQKKSAAEG